MSDWEPMNFPEGFDVDVLVSYGISGLVVLDRSFKIKSSDPNLDEVRTIQTVIKSPNRVDDQGSIDLEASVYERLQEHEAHSVFLKYYGRHPCPLTSPPTSAIRLEYAENGTLKYFLTKHPPKVTREDRLRWSKQITDGLSHLHSLNIIHGDLTCVNIFLTKDLDARIADFANSSMDGSPLFWIIKANPRYPGPLLSVKADIFALGSVLYHIWRGKEPYYELASGIKEDEQAMSYQNEEEITKIIAKGDFPETDSLGDMGGIIARCWRGAFETAKEVAEEVSRSVAIPHQDYKAQ